MQVSVFCLFCRFQFLFRGKSVLISEYLSLQSRTQQGWRLSALHLAIVQFSFFFPQSEDNEKEINRLSTFPFPPCINSINRRFNTEWVFNYLFVLKGISWLIPDYFQLCIFIIVLWWLLSLFKVWLGLMGQWWEWQHPRCCVPWLSLINQPIWKKKNVCGQLFSYRFCVISKWSLSLVCLVFSGEQGEPSLWDSCNSLHSHLFPPDLVNMPAVPVQHPAPQTTRWPFSRTPFSAEPSNIKSRFVKYLIELPIKFDFVVAKDLILWPPYLQVHVQSPRVQEIDKRSKITTPKLLVDGRFKPFRARVWRCQLLLEKETLALFFTSGHNRRLQLRPLRRRSKGPALPTTSPWSEGTGWGSLSAKWNAVPWRRSVAWKRAANCWRFVFFKRAQIIISTLRMLL